jgi:ATP-dependent DNA ligase
LSGYSGRRTVKGKGPMLAKLETDMPRGEGWTYEPKWDGFRTTVIVKGDEVRLISRDDRPMGRYFPEVGGVVGSLRTGNLVADGEIVRISNAEFSFDELQLRLHPAESRVRMLSGQIPAWLFLFDLLEDGGEDLRKRPLSDRRERLTALAKRIGAEPVPEDLSELPEAPGCRLTPWTSNPEVAERWFRDEKGIGQDGIVAKRVDQAYLAGVRGWVKVKHRRTADCVVGGYRVAKGGDGVGSLLLGLYDDAGRLHYVGHTSSFKAAERRAIKESLAPLEGGTGFGGEMARSPGGPSRWTVGKELEWVSLEPVLVCEVSFERMQSGRFRHAATFVRWRDDRKPESCTFEQIGESPAVWPGMDGSG